MYPKCLQAVLLCVSQCLSPRLMGNAASYSLLSSVAPRTCSLASSLAFFMAPKKPPKHGLAHAVSRRRPAAKAKAKAGGKRQPRPQLVNHKVLDVL
eukprot:5506370-Amphidinium_carterae.1